MKKPRRKRPGLPPIDVQIEVAERQLRARGLPTEVVFHDTQEAKLHVLLDRLARAIGCEVGDLQLDHEPMLRRRAYRVRRGRPIASWYSPHAHDPGHLLWRSKRPQDADSHHTKTYVRGARGQLPDVILANRERRHEKDPGRWLGVRGLKKPKPRKPRHSTKRKGVKRPIQSRGFPPAGSRPFNRRVT